MPDLLVRGATVVDGSGARRHRADVTAADGLIEEIGHGLAGRRVVDADGLVLAPGLIDNARALRSLVQHRVDLSGV